MNIIEEFNQSVHELETFKNKLTILFHELLTSSGINPHQITSRVKSPDSLKRKIQSKQDKYNVLADITDCVGIRIISYLEDEVDVIAKLILEEFDIDHDNSIDKRKLEIDRFGYKSLHFVVSLSQERLKLREYSSFKYFKAEIQIRSILQHSWAEIEHDLGYKSEISVPEFVKRDFFRVAALLETADIEFVKIKNSISEYKNLIDAELELSPNKFSLDKDTITSYLDKSEVNKEVVKLISQATGLPATEKSYGQLDYTLKVFSKYGINSIEELDSLIKKFQKEISNFEIECLTKGGLEYTALGTAPSIHALAEMILLENDDFNIPCFGEGITFEDRKAILKRVMKSRKILQTKPKKH